MTPKNKVVWLAAGSLCSLCALTGSLAWLAHQPLATKTSKDANAAPAARSSWEPAQSDGIFGSAGQLAGPVGIALDGEKIYVADRGHSRIAVFDRNTRQLLGAFGSPGSGPGEFNQLEDAVVIGHLLYVSDRLNHRIQIFDSKSFAYVGEFGSHGRRQGQFNQPVGLCSDGELLYVSDHENHRIQIFDATSHKFVAAIGEAGNEDGNFFRPAGIAVDRDAIYVAEWGNNRIQVFERKSRKFLGKIDNYRRSDGREKFIRTHGIAVTDSLILTAGVGNSCILAFDKRSLRAVGTFAAGGTAVGQISKLHAFAYADGMLYTPEYGNNRVQVWKIEAQRHVH